METRLWMAEDERTFYVGAPDDVLASIVTESHLRMRRWMYDLTVFGQLTVEKPIDWSLRAAYMFPLVTIPHDRVYLTAGLI